MSKRPNKHERAIAAMQAIQKLMQAIYDKEFTGIHCEDFDRTWTLDPEALVYGKGFAFGNSDSFRHAWVSIIPSRPLFTFVTAGKPWGQFQSTNIRDFIRKIKLASTISRNDEYNEAYCCPLAKAVDCTRCNSSYQCPVHTDGKPRCVSSCLGHAVPHPRAYNRGPE